MLLPAEAQWTMDPASSHSLAGSRHNSLTLDAEKRIDLKITAAHSSALGQLLQLCPQASSAWNSIHPARPAHIPWVKSICLNLPNRMKRKVCPQYPKYSFYFIYSAVYMNYIHKINNKDYIGFERSLFPLQPHWKKDAAILFRTYLWYKKKNHKCVGFDFKSSCLFLSNTLSTTDSMRPHLTDALRVSKQLGRLHGDAQRWESNKAINNVGHSLVQDKIEVECALTGPFLLLLLISLQHRDAEREKSQQSQGEEHASLRPRHLSRFLLTSPTLWQIEIFTLSIDPPFLSRLFVYITLFLGYFPLWAESIQPTAVWCSF